jgi:hypothetical protein
MTPGWAVRDERAPLLRNTDEFLFERLDVDVGEVNVEELHAAAAAAREQSTSN